MKQLLLIFLLSLSVSAKTIRDDLTISARPSGTDGGDLTVDSTISIGNAPESNSPTWVLALDDTNGVVKRASFDSLTVATSDSAGVSGYADTASVAGYADSSGVAGTADTALNTPDSVRASWKSDTAGVAGTADTALNTPDSVRASWKSDTAGVAGTADTAQYSWASYISRDIEFTDMESGGDTVLMRHGDSTIYGITPANLRTLMGAATPDQIGDTCDARIDGTPYYNAIFTEQHKVGSGWQHKSSDTIIQLSDKHQFTNPTNTSKTITDTIQIIAEREAEPPDTLVSIDNGVLKKHERSGMSWTVSQVAGLGDSLANYLKLDQSTPQTVDGGVPVFDDGMQSNGNVLIGTDTPYNSRTFVDISNGDNTLVLGADLDANTRTDETAKYVRILGAHYTNAEEPVILINSTSNGTSNIINIGGGTSRGNASTQIRLYTAANTTTTNGSTRMTIDSDGTINLATVANAGTDTDKFLVWDAGGDLDYRTGAEVLSDIGAAADADMDGKLNNSNFDDSINNYLPSYSANEGFVYVDESDAEDRLNSDNQLSHESNQLRIWNLQTLYRPTLPQHSFFTFLPYNGYSVAFCAGRRYDSYCISRIDSTTAKTSWSSDQDTVDFKIDSAGQTTINKFVRTMSPCTLSHNGVIDIDTAYREDHGKIVNVILPRLGGTLVGSYETALKFDLDFLPTASDPTPNKLITAYTSIAGSFGAVVYTYGNVVGADGNLIFLNGTLTGSGYVESQVINFALK